MTGRAFDPTPPAVGVGATVAAAAVALVATVVVPQAGALVAVGTAVMAVGVARGVRQLHAVGAVVVFGGVLLLGVASAPTSLVLVGAVATILAWDVGANAIDLGVQIGSEGRCRRAVAVHAATSGGFATAVVTVTYGVYRLALAGEPASATIVLAFAAVVFAVLLAR